jgi:16S rRNA (cytosine967-C5)-methyltransferase
MMRLGGRIAAAVEVLEDMAKRHRPASEALKDWGLSHRFAGSGDRAAIGNLVYDALRNKLSLGWRMGSDEHSQQIFAVLLDGWGETAASLTQKLDGDKFAPALPVAAVLERFAAANLTEAPMHIQADMPEWAAGLLAPVFQENLAEEGRSLSARPPVDLRVNRLLSNRDKVLSELPQGIGALASRLSPDGIRIPSGPGDYRQPNVQVEPAFQKGWFEIQDEGSQLAAMLAGAAPGESVLDYCAGGGGKTLELASLMGNKGQIHATDSDKSRLAPIFERLKRAETRNVQVHPAKSDLMALEGKMDCVLIDAPCTGAGTWRRRPDAKWRLSAAQLAQRGNEQAGILDAAKQYVKPGGRLVYVTCSLFQEENAAQAERFLAGNADFAFADHTSRLAALIPGLRPEEAYLSKQGVTLTPRLTGTDGFFISVLERG